MKSYYSAVLLTTCVVVALFFATLQHSPTSISPTATLASATILSATTRPNTAINARGLSRPSTSRPRSLTSTSLHAYLNSLNADDLAAVFTDQNAFGPGEIPPEWRHALLTRWIELAPIDTAEFGHRSGPRDLALVLTLWSQQDEITAAEWSALAIDAELAAVLFRHHQAFAITPSVAWPLFSKLTSENAQASWGASILSRASNTQIEAWLGPALNHTLGRQTLVHFALQQSLRARSVLLHRLSSGPEHRQIRDILISQWAQQDPLEAAIWVDQQSDPTLRAAAWASLTARWSQIAPEQAAQIVSALPPGIEQAQAIVSVVSGWARHDPGAVGDWIVQLPEGAQKWEAIRQLIDVWGRQNAGSAATWIKTLPDAQSRRVAEVALATQSGQ